MIDKIKTFLIYLMAFPLVIFFYYTLSSYIPETFTGQNMLIAVLLFVIMFATLYKHLHES